MAIQIIDGFDLYNGTGAGTGLKAKWSCTDVSRVSLVAGRFGGQAFNYNDVTALDQSMSRGLGVATAQGTVGFALNFTSFPGNPTTVQQFQLANVANKSIGIRVTGTGSIQVYRATGNNVNDASSGVLLATSAGNLVTGTWYYVEVEYVVDDAVGRVTVYVNGASFVTATNVDTNNAVGTVDTMYFGGTFGGAAGVFKVDDLYSTNTAARLGERRVETLRPTADTAQKNFVPSTGANNSALVDDTTADSADYVQGSVVGDLDLYDMGDLSTTPAVIDAVQATFFALKTDATSRNIAAVVDLSAVQTQSADMALGASAGKFDAIMATKPGGGAWSSVSVNGLKLGPKVTL